MVSADHDGRPGRVRSIFSAGNVPDISVRQLRMPPIYKGYNTGQVNGSMVTQTAEAITVFRAATGMPRTGDVDFALITAFIPGCGAGRFWPKPEP